jgi:DNA-binding beta-propeller fold protein YncE
MHHPSIPLAIAAALLCTGAAAQAQIAISANDGKAVLINGVNEVAKAPVADTVAIIDLSQSPPKIIAEVEAPASVVGPPVSVAITPDEGLALVTSAMKIDPADATKSIPDNRMSVIDLKASPPKVIATLQTGASPAGVSINRQGTLALVANRAEGTVSVFKIAGKEVSKLDTVAIADAKSGPSHVAISPDSKMALVTRDGDFRISVLAIDGEKVTYTKRDLYAGLRPYGIDISAKGDIAVVANIGLGAGDHDTISVIDLKAKVPHVVETVTVGQTPEGIILSPDGSMVGVVVVNGSNKAESSPFFNANGKLVLFKVDGTKLTKHAEAPIGRWSQGVVFSNDGKTVMVQNMVESNLQAFKIEGDKLTEIANLKLKGGGAALRTAQKPM